MKRSLFVLASILAASICLTSCTQKYLVSTNTFIDSKIIPQGFPQNTKFVVIPVDGKSLFSDEIRHKIEKILESKGYLIAHDTSKADYGVFFDCSISSEAGTITVPRYIPGQTQTTKGNVYGSYGNFASYNQTTQSSGTTVYIPQDYIYYIRTLQVSVYNVDRLQNHKLELPIWSGSAVSSGENGDLRTAIDYLLVSTFDHFGKSTGKIVQRSLKTEDEAVVRLRKSS